MFALNRRSPDSRRVRDQDRPFERLEQWAAALITRKRRSKPPVGHAAALNPGCSKCIKAHLRGRHFRHLMPMVAHAGPVVPEAGQSATGYRQTYVATPQPLPSHSAGQLRSNHHLAYGSDAREYDLTLLHPDDKLGRDIAIMRTEIEELHAKLARTPAVIARAALGIIFSTAIITTLLGWWFLV
jgi:hypothetical protein